ncbi:MAG: hypothetical protein GY865_20360, partial [candidate division Zixibacteria bacterium]|nr:hypothetical protein [candidate division Zixibacteria bacterium]
NNDIIIVGSNFFNVQNIVFSNSADFWFRGIDIDIDRSTLTSIYCTAMCGTDLAPQGMPRERGLFDVYVTAVNDLTGYKADVVNLVTAKPPEKVMDVTIELSNDYKHVIVKWNGPNDAMIYTNVNRYYSPFSEVDGNWGLAEDSASWPYVFDASGTESLYLHLCHTPTGPNPLYDAPYDVGKYDVELPGADGTNNIYYWLGCPFNLFDNTFKGIFKDILTPEGLFLNRDAVVQQEIMGSSGISQSQYDGSGNFTGNYTSWEKGKGYLLKRNKTHTVDITLTYVGWISTNDTVVSGVQKSNGVDDRFNWLTYPYPVKTILEDTGLDNGIVTPEGFFLDRDILTQQQSPGLSGVLKSQYSSSGWTGIDENATNAHPGVFFNLNIDKTHTTPAVTNWIIPKPY